MSEEVIKPKIGAYRRHILICTGTRCTQDGQSQALFDSLGDKFKAAGINDGEMRVKRSRVSCFAACKGGPVMCVGEKLGGGGRVGAGLRPGMSVNATVDWR